jgi:hypothetical protein
MLSREEQLLLIEHLVAHLRVGEALAPESRRWEDYAGTAPRPLCGEDAQVWVTRTRQESDADRSIP